jgi:methyl-accepting chemotaxis protein
MIETRIETANAVDPSAVNRVAAACGEVAVGCTEAGGLVESVAERISRQINVLGELQAVMASLETDQRQVTDANDEARRLAENARARLTEGGRTIATSVA